MCELLEVHFAKGRCRTRGCIQGDGNESRTLRVKQCRDVLKGRHCKGFHKTVVEVPLHCSHHRGKVIKPNVDSYMRSLRHCTMVVPETGETVKKLDHLHQHVEDRVRQYPRILEQWYDYDHEAAITAFCNHYIRTGTLGFPQGTSARDYDRLPNRFNDKLSLALREFKHFVVIHAPPVDQPESVRKSYWEWDDPVIAMLNAAIGPEAV